MVPVTPFPSPSPVPDDWATYTQPASQKSDGFTLSHPAGWLVDDPNVAIASQGEGLSIVMYSWKEGPPPPNSMKVDIAVDPVASGVGYSGCQPPGQAPASLGGTAGWQTALAYDPATSDGLTAVRQVAADRSGLRYCLIAFFIEGIDETTFFQILNSFRFTD